MVDEAVKFRYQVETRYQQAVEYRIFLALESAEQVVQVVYKHRIASKQSAVGIERGGLLVEIPGTDIGVTRQLVPLCVAAQYEGHFGVHLQSGYAEQNVDAGSLHHLCGRKVVFFIEAGFQLYEDGYLLAVLCCGYQSVDDCGVLGNAVLGYHDFVYRRFVHGFIQEMNEVLERVVRVMQQQVFLFYIAEDRLPFVQASQLHGLGLADRTYGFVGIGQMPEVFHIEVLVARHQFLPVDVESVYQEVQEIVRYGTVIYKAADGPYLALLYFRLHLLYYLGGIGRLVYQNIRIP